MNEHIVKSYEDELNSLTAECARMAGLTEAQVGDSIDAVVKRDRTLAEAIVGRDERLDILEADIERKAIRLIALRQPMANDLRKTVAAMKIAMNLERCGDLAKNIAKRTLVLTESEPMSPLTRGTPGFLSLCSSSVLRLNGFRFLPVRRDIVCRDREMMTNMESAMSKRPN